MKTLLTILLLVLASLCLPVSTLHAQKTAFTAEDALRVESTRLLEITKNGRYLVLSSGTRKDRMGTDHQRYRDPTYVSPRYTKLQLLDTETKQSRPIFDHKVILIRTAPSHDDTRLALLLYEEKAFKIAIYQLDNNKVKRIKIKSEKTIASNSALAWKPDGSQLLISLRDSGWLHHADSLYTEASSGPRTVYDSSKPFLKWEEISQVNNLNIPTLLNIESGRTQELLPASQYSGLNIDKSNQRLNFIEVLPQKTVYNRKGGTQYGLYSLSLDELRLDTLSKSNTKRLSVLWNEDHNQYAFADSGKLFRQNIFEPGIVRIGVDTTEIVAGDTIKAKFSVQRWAPKQKHILARSKTGYWLVDLASNQMEKVYSFPDDQETAPNRSIVAWSPNEDSWFMSHSAKDKWERGLIRYDLITKESSELLMGSDQFSNWNMTKDGRLFFYYHSNGDEPTELYMSDISFSSPQKLTDANPWIQQKTLTSSELVSYRDSDGKKLYGVLYYPVNYEKGKQYPLVCEIYETFFNNGFNTNMNILCNQGFFGFRPSVNLIQGYPGEAWIKGVTAGINTLIDRGLVDPDQLGVHGTSYGGYASSLLITQTDRFAAAINISGKVNIISFLGDSPKIGTRNYAAAEVGQDRIGSSLWEAPLKYLATTAVLHADRIKTPHLLLTGEGDWNVPGVNSRELYYAMRRLGKEVVWVNYHNGGHGAGWASDEADYLDQWERIIDWYKKCFEKNVKSQNEVKDNK